jgi:hypothetical protein
MSLEGGPIIAILVVAAVLAAPSVEQHPPAAPPPVSAIRPAVPQEAPSAEAIAEAMKLFERDELRNQMMAGFMVGVSEAIAHQRARTEGSGGLDEQAAARLQAAVRPEIELAIDAELPNFRRQAALVYARNFTLEELRELNELNQRPLFRKMERLTPVLMGQIMQMSRMMFQPYEERFRERGLGVFRQLMEERRARDSHS